MEVSQRIAVSGMLASQRLLDVVSNNLANVSTTGFKGATAHTTDIGYQAGLTAPVGPNGSNLQITGIGEGTQLADVSQSFLPGAVQATGNPFDVALQGDGFFTVKQTDGTPAYTRDGSFTIDSTGRLVNSDGLPVQSDQGTDLVVPQGTQGAQLDDNGQLIAIDATGAQQVVGSLGIAVFPNNQGLQAAGANLWTSTPASGQPTTLAQGAANAPAIVSGALEGSNVD